ncbi:uncharacterized protein [Antedon mediterranea]|uniref:uncharacterized protein n=1 Tax=Antedon mediterranea TaxID=105859 RepID=UPI003AF49D25
MTVSKCEICDDEEEERDVIYEKLELTTEEDVQKWLEAFQRSSSLTWRKSKTYPNSGRYNTYRVDMRCQHNTRSSKPKPGKGTKNTGCPATMNLVLKRSITNSKTQDQHVKHGLLFNVRLKNEHNHRITCADALRRRDVSEDSIAKLRDLFEHGHSPSSALETIKHDLAEEHGEQYVYVCADRFMCPDLQFCYRSYYKTFQKVYGASSGELMYVDLEKRVLYMR